MNMGRENSTITKWAFLLSLKELRVLSVALEKLVLFHHSSTMKMSLKWADL